MRIILWINRYEIDDIDKGLRNIKIVDRIRKIEIINMRKWENEWMVDG